LSIRFFRHNHDATATCHFKSDCHGPPSKTRFASTLLWRQIENSLPVSMNNTTIDKFKKHKTKRKNKYFVEQEKKFFQASMTFFNKSLLQMNFVMKSLSNLNHNTTKIFSLQPHKGPHLIMTKGPSNEHFSPSTQKHTSLCVVLPKSHVHTPSSFDKTIILILYSLKLFLPFNFSILGVILIFLQELVINLKESIQY